MALQTILLFLIYFVRMIGHQRGVGQGGDYTEGKNKFTFLTLYKTFKFCTDLNGRMAKQKYCLEIIPCTLIYFVNQIRQHIWVGQNGGKANLKKK